MPTIADRPFCRLIIRGIPRSVPVRERVRCLLLACAAVLLAAAPGLNANARAAEVSFLRDVAPILLQRCAGCHGPKKAEGDFRLYTFNYLLSPGASESNTVVAGKPEESEIVLRITEPDESMRMPQEDDPLSPSEIDLIRRWIGEGAKFDGRDRDASISSQLPPRIHPDPPEQYRVPVPIYALAFSPDGRQLAVGGHHEVTLWDPQTGALLRRIKSLPDRIQALVYSRDGSRLIVGGGTPGEYGEVAVVDLAGAQRRSVLGTFEDLVLCVAVSHDETRAVATSADRGVRAYNLNDGHLLWSSELHFDWVTCAAFSYDDRFVATGSRDFTIKVLNAADGSLFTTYNGHQRQLGKESGRFAVFSLAFSDNSPLAFSAGEGNSIRVWEPEKARQENGSAADMEIRFYKAGHTQFLMHQSKNPVFKLVARGNDLFAATGDGPLLQYDISTLKLVRTFAGHRDWVFAADYQADSHRLASGAFDGEVRVWDTDTGDLVTSFVAAPGLSPNR